MSTFDYAGVRVTTLALLTQFGNSLTLERINDGAVFDPSTGNKTGGTTIILNGTGVLLNFSVKEIGDAARSGATTIRATDRKLLYQGDPLLINDNFNGWRVHAIIELDPDESGTILTTAQMRK